ncbi:MAG TPA: DUF4231 domain-containing protein [Acidimicrobiales bacterium]|jgi:hypothetical protein
MATRVGDAPEVRPSVDGRPVGVGLGLGSDMPVLVVAGTTATIEPDIAVRLLPTLKAVVALAAEHGIALVTGGTDVGVFHLLSLALSSSPGARPPLVVGVAPDALVADPGAEPGPDQSRADPQLDALVRVDGKAWGDEVVALSRLVADIAGGQPSGLLLVGGGDVSRADLAEHLARGRPVVVLEGTGRLADALGDGRLPAGDEGDERIGANGDGDAPPLADLPALLAAGDVRVVAVDDRQAVTAHLTRALVRGHRRPLRDRMAVLALMPRVRYRPLPPTPPLTSAQARDFPLLLPRVAEAEREIYPAFARFEVAARREQNRHRWFSVLAILGALLTTAFGATQVWLQSVAWPGVVVATLGAATSVLTTLARRQGTLDTFLDARTRAERLRALYFAHLRRPPAADGAAADAELVELGRQVAALASGPVNK